MKKILTILFLLLTCTAFAQNCPDEGNATSQRLKNLNTLKNREIKPGKLDKTVTLQKILKSGEDTGRFSDDQYVCITGWCVLAKWGGPEGCNCKSSDRTQWDIHIVISSDSAVTNQDSCMIVEITRKYRDAHDPLKPSDFMWHKVRVTGYLFRDDEHTRNSVNDAEEGTKDLFRKTPWEIHPVVEIEILQ